MSDNQRRVYCRILFLALCLLPTSITSYWICHPQTSAGWSQAIQAKLGVETEIGSIETPGPYKTILRNVRFLDGEEVLFSTPEVHIELGDRLWNSQKQNRVVVPYLVGDLDRFGLAYLAKRINQHVMRTNGAEQIWRIDFVEDVVVDRYTKAEIENHEAELADQGNLLDRDHLWLQRNQLRLAGLRFDIAPTAAGSSTTAYFSVRDSFAADNSNSPESIGRNETMTFELDTRRLAPANHRSLEQVVKLNTNQGKLPVWLLDSVEHRLVASLGAQSKFEGKFEITPSSGRLDDLVGTFSNVNLLPYDRGSNRPELKGQIKVNRCRYENGGFTAWSAFLSEPSILGPMEIRQSDLQIEAQQIAIGPAIRQTYRIGKQRLARSNAGTSNK